jgi:hypothetical protein
MIVKRKSYGEVPHSAIPNQNASLALSGKRRVEVIKAGSA